MLAPGACQTFASGSDGGDAFANQIMINLTFTTGPLPVATTTRVESDGSITKKFDPNAMPNTTLALYLSKTPITAKPNGTCAVPTLSAALSDPSVFFSRSQFNSGKYNISDNASTVQFTYTISTPCLPANTTWYWLAQVWNVGMKADGSGFEAGPEFVGMDGAAISMASDGVICDAQAKSVATVSPFSTSITSTKNFAHVGMMKGWWWIVASFLFFNV